jgi:hypothetical protein
MSTQATGPAPAAERRHSLGAPLPLRVGFVGEGARKLLGGSVEAVSLEPGASGEASGLAALVVEAEPAGFDRAQVKRLATSARESGAVVIGVWTGEGEAIWDEVADLAVGAPGAPAGKAVAIAPPADVRTFNPLNGFRELDAAGYAAVISGRSGTPAELDRGRALLDSVAEHEPVLALVHRGTDVPPLGPEVQRAPLPRAPMGVLRKVRPRLGVIDHPSFHDSEWQRAGWIARLSAAGVPVACAELSAVVRELLGEELAGLLDGVAVRDLADLDVRERVSVALRRAALRGHSTEAGWRRICAAVGIPLPSRPMISVIFATRREDWLEHGLAQVARQTYEPRELVVCLHGDAFSDDIEERVRATAPKPLKIVRVDGDLVLGDALNAGVEVAEGDLITKMDDDDYYNTDHLWDLALACEYAEADLVGKAAEFAYLEWIDLTIRRFMGDAESDHPRLAGGALMARREPLLAVGGWPSRARGEDTWIVKNFKRAGKRTWRTHGFGYILNRHGRDHTWNTNADYFLVQSQREWRGLRFDQTAID